MAVTWYIEGNSVIGVESVATGEYMDLAAPANTVYKIQNIFFAARVIADMYDGTNTVPFFDSTTEDEAGSFQFADIPCHDDARMRIKNQDDETQVIAVTGVKWE